MDRTNQRATPSGPPDEAPLTGAAAQAFYLGLLKLALDDLPAPIPQSPDRLDATALGNGLALVTLTSARRANSFNDYKQQQGTDPEPVKLGNFPDTQHTFDNLPVGQTLTFTVRGVNDAGEGPASAADTIVIS